MEHGEKAVYLPFAAARGCEILSEQIAVKRSLVRRSGLCQRVYLGPGPKHTILRVRMAQQCVGEHAEDAANRQMMARHVRDARQRHELGTRFGSIQRPKVPR